MGEQFSQEPKSNKTAITAVISILITALVVGGGVFAYGQSQIKKISSESTSQLQQLQSQITQLQAQVDNAEIEAMEKEKTMVDTMDKSDDKDANQIDDWSTFTNTTYKYTLQYPKERRLYSNHFGVTDAEQAQWAMIDEFSIRRYDREYNLNQYPEVSFDLEKYANLVWEYNKNDDNPNTIGKKVGDLTKTTVNEEKAYQFTLTKSYVSYTGGYVLDTEHLYTLISFDGTIYEIWFPTNDQENYKMLNTLSFIK